MQKQIIIASFIILTITSVNVKSKNKDSTYREYFIGSSFFIHYTCKYEH